MHSTLSLVDRIHSQALEISSRYRRAEAELIDILQQVEEHRVFLKRGHSSLFGYVVNELGLGENVAYSLITVARKSQEIPALKTQLQSGAMTLTNARRVVAVLTPSNQAEWIPKACALSSRELEKEVVRVHPQAATVERTSYVSHDRIRLELGISEKETLRLRRAQDLLSQAKRRPVSLEETISILTAEFLERHDPVEKAKRHQVKKGGLTEDTGKTGQLVPAVAFGPTHVGVASTSPTPTDAPPNMESSPLLVARRMNLDSKRSRRLPIPAKERHRVNLRDQRRCTHLLPDGSRCNQSRWIEIHHRVAVSQGGSNSAKNLATLCSAHHKLRHLDSVG